MTVPAFDPNSTTFMQDTQAACRAKLRELLASDRLSVFVFATSSLKGVPIQSVVIDATGKVISDKIIGTAEPLDPGSQAFHGLQQEQVNGGVELKHWLPILGDTLGDRCQVITFSPDFMREALVRACRLEGLEMFGTSHWVNGQELLAPLCGSYNWTTNRWSRPKLTDCIKDIAMPAEFAPIGTALGNVQRLHALMVHFSQEPADRGLGTPCIGRCEQCGLAMDECRCYSDPYQEQEVEW